MVGDRPIWYTLPKRSPRLGRSAAPARPIDRMELSGAAFRPGGIPDGAATSRNAKAGKPGASSWSRALEKVLALAIGAPKMSDPGSKRNWPSALRKPRLPAYREIRDASPLYRLCVGRDRKPISLDRVIADVAGLNDLFRRR